MKYNLLTIENEDGEIFTYNVARTRSRHIRITIKNDGKAYATRPYYVNNEEFIKFLKSKLPWVKKSISKIKIIPNEQKISKEELKNKIENYVNKYEKELGVIVECIKYRKMTTQWGSCSKNKFKFNTGTIRFSTELTKCNDNFIEYVVLHEMAHIIENNHSKNFWAIVKKYIPNYKILDKY